VVESDLKMVRAIPEGTRERIRETLAQVPQPNAEFTLSGDAERANLRTLRK